MVETDIAECTAATGGNGIHIIFLADEDIGLVVCTSAVKVTYNSESIDSFSPTARSYRQGTELINIIVQPIRMLRHGAVMAIGTSLLGTNYTVTHTKTTLLISRQHCN